MTQQLTQKQRKAVDLLAEGKPDAEVGHAVGVDRSTVWRWRTENSSVQAELNRRHFELWDASVERLRSLVPSALDALAAQLEGPNQLKAAEVVLRIAGFDAARKGGINLRPQGAVDADGIDRAREERREMDEMLAPLLVPFSK